MGITTESLQEERIDNKQERGQKRNKKRKVFLVGLPLLIVIMIIVFLKVVIIPQFKYDQALSLLEDKEYLKSYNLFKELDDYKDSEIIIENFRFFPKKEREYDSMGQEKNTKEYIYDSNKNCLKIADSIYNTVSYQYTFDDEGNCVETKEGDYVRKYKYDSRGNCIGKSSAYGENIYKYDDNGNKVEEEEVTYTEGWSYRDTIKYVYDKNNNCIQKLEFSNNGGLRMTEYTYDEMGNCIKEERIDRKGKREVIQLYCYDEKGNCVQSYDPNVHRIFGTEGPARTIEKVYDENENCIRETLTFLENSGYTDENITEFKYDKQGNCVEEVSTSRGYDNHKTVLRSSQSKTEFTYDKNGNLIKKVETSEYGTKKNVEPFQKK